jgi:predicted anti-sigma-YlaC factor YlaD
MTLGGAESERAALGGEMSCQAFVEIASDHLEGALPPGERARLEEHVATCRDCGAYLDQLTTTVAILGRLGVAQVTPAAREHLLSAFRAWAADAAQEPR